MTNETRQTAHTLVPAVDIIETSAAYVVRLDIPGAERERISAKVEENTLTVSAPVSAAGEVSKDIEPVREYRREFSLANDVDVQSIDARYELGVLTITLNKKTQYLPKEISIN